MEEQFGFEHASALVFASGAPNQMLMNALNRRGAGFRRKLCVLCNELAVDIAQFVCVGTTWR